MAKETNPIQEIISSYKKAFISLWIFSFVMNLLMLAPSFYMLQVYDRVFMSKNVMTLFMLSLILIFLFFIFSCLDYIRNLIAIRLGNQLELKVNEKIYTASFKANLNQAGINVSQSMQDLNTVRQFLTSAPIFALFDAPWLPINLAIIYFFNFKIGLFATLGSVVLIALAIINEYSSKGLFQQAGEKSIVSNNLASNNLRNAETIAALGMLSSLRSRWKKIRLEYLSLQGKVSQKSGFISAMSKFVRLSFQSLILGYGAYLVIQNEISPGMVIAGSILMGRVMNPVESLIGLWGQFDLTRNAYGRLSQLLKVFPENLDRMELPKPQGHLVLESISAAPPGSNALILKNISLGLNPGDVLGVLGLSGAGKSTLGRLIIGVWPPGLGKVRLDGADLYQWDKDKLGPHLGYLPQDVELFSGTISENISRFGAQDAEEVIKAAKLAGLHDTILKFPQGYDTYVTDGGKNLSGGQRQRVGLARALYGEPCLIVLDEPISHADEQGELALIHTVKSLKEKNKTVIVISHKTQIITETTQLLILDQGTVRLYGKTADVIKQLSQNKNMKIFEAPTTKKYQ